MLKIVAFLSVLLAMVASKPYHYEQYNPYVPHCSCWHNLQHKDWDHPNADGTYPELNPPKKESHCKCVSSSCKGKLPRELYSLPNLDLELSGPWKFSEPVKLKNVLGVQFENCAGKFSLENLKQITVGSNIKYIEIRCKLKRFSFDGLGLDDKLDKVRIENKDLEYFPFDAPQMKVFRKFSLRKTNIGKMLKGADIEINMPALEEVYIKKSDLQGVNLGKFLGKTQLTEMDISENDIDQATWDTLRNAPKTVFKKMDELEFEENEITSVDFHDFDMPVLEELHMNENPITHLRLPANAATMRIEIEELPLTSFTIEEVKESVPKIEITENPLMTSFDMSNVKKVEELVIEENPGLEDLIVGDQVPVVTQELVVKDNDKLECCGGLQKLIAHAKFEQPAPRYPGDRPPTELRLEGKCRSNGKFIDLKEVKALNCDAKRDEADLEAELKTIIDEAF